MLTSEQVVDSFARAFFAGFLPRSFYGVGRIERKLRHVDRRELAVALEKPPIDDDAIDVPGSADCTIMFVAMVNGSMLTSVVRTRIKSARLPGVSDPM